MQTAVYKSPPENDALFNQRYSSLPSTPLVVNNAEESPLTVTIYDFWTRRDLLLFLAWRDIKIRYKQTIMGVVWVILQPLLMMLVFAVFFGIILRVYAEGMPHLLFFYCGLLPWTFFSNAVNGSSMSLVNNSQLITKVYFPRMIVPTATVGAGFVDLLIGSVILIGLALYFKMPLTWGYLMLPVLLSVTVVLTLGCSLWAAALSVKYRDIRHVLPFVLQVWFFVTPVIYPLEVVPEKWRWILFLNPMVGITEGIRDAVVGRNFEWHEILIATGMTITIFLCSIHIFSRFEKSMADTI